MTEAIEAEVTEVEQPAAVVEAQETEQAEQTSDAAPDSTEAETTKPPETEEQRRSKYQRRIDRKNADIAAARTEAKMLREQLERLEGSRSAPQRDAAAPKLEQFDNFEDYIAARVAYDAEKIVESRLSKVQQAEQARKAQEESTRIASTWQEREAAAIDKYSDYEEVVGESSAPLSREMGQAIVESDLGTDIAYYLAQHPEEAKAIYALSPTRQIAAIGRLEAKVSTPVQRKTTNAPAPIEAVGSKAKADKAPTDMSDAEFAKWRKGFIARR